MSKKKTRNKDKGRGHAIDAVVFGVVQGVGFRPFVYRIAKDLGYTGWVKNIGFGVEIHLESKTRRDYRDFWDAFDEHKPPLAQIEDIKINPAEFINDLEVNNDDEKYESLKQLRLRSKKLS